VITQLSIEHGSPLYAVKYSDEMTTNEKDVDFELDCDL
jgi:uncharacterized protein YpmB